MLSNIHKITMLNERVITLDQKLLVEKRTKLLVEALDDSTLQMANNIINKLRKVKGKGLKSLDAAVSEAENQLNKYTGGGVLTKALTKIKSVVGIDNPLVKFMTFANALENGFRQLPTIINNATDQDLKQNVDKTLGELVTDKDKRQQLGQNLIKALSPTGVFGSFKKIPYVDKEVLAQELLTLPIKNLAAVLQAMTTGPNTQQISDELKTQIGGQGEVETKATTPSEPSKPTSGTTTTEPSKQTSSSTRSTETGQTTKPKSQINIAKDIYDELSIQLIDAVGSESKAKLMLKILADEDKLK